MTLTTAPQSALPVAERRATPEANDLRRDADHDWRLFLLLGRLDDYRQGPLPATLPECVTIDREQAETPCPECNWLRHYRPFHKDGSYRVFSVCYRCWSYEEI